MAKAEDPVNLGDETDPGARSSGTIGFVTVTARRRDGAEETARVDKPVGSPERELGWDDLEAKFHDCANQAGLAADFAADSFAAWRALRGADDVAGLLRSLA
jgi:2-methylcitrate dehydratase PrpD